MRILYLALCCEFRFLNQKQVILDSKGGLQDKITFKGQQKDKCSNYSGLFAGVSSEESIEVLHISFI